MRLVIVTQKDPFYLPAAIDRFLKARGADVRALIILPSFNESLAATCRRLYEFYGPIDMLRLCTRYFWAKAADQINRLKPCMRPYSPEEAARRHSIPIYRPSKINDDRFLQTLRDEIRPDLIVSIAASQIFRQRLLSTAPFGCINLHSAPLPRYQGMMPNFWVLMHGKPHGSVTVHKMNRALDSGDIILQRPVAIYDDDSLHDIMVRSKVVGVEALLTAIEQIENGTVKAVPMDEQQATYFSFPKRADALQLRKKGRALL